MSLIITMLVLGIIIMIHGFGHFLFARLNGIGVTEFSLDMGLRLFSFEKGGTRYSFRVLPFGDSCMMLGENEGITDESAFNNKSVWARISVMAVGPMFNFILAFGLSMMLIGITGYDTTRLTGVVGRYSAQTAGMEAGDVTKSINGKKVHSCRDIDRCLSAHPQKSLKATWERTERRRGTERFSAELEPVFSAKNSRYVMGVQFNPVPGTVENIGQLLAHSAYEVQYWIHYVPDTFYMVFRGIASVNDISDPVGIMSAIDTTMDETAPYSLSAVMLMLINFTILLSTDLGVMNLLPIPTLDGKRLVFLIMKAAGGRPIDREKEGMAHVAGVMVLLALMVLILFNDVRRLF